MGIKREFSRVGVEVLETTPDLLTTIHLCRLGQSL